MAVCLQPRSIHTHNKTFYQPPSITQPCSCRFGREKPAGNFQPPLRDTAASPARGRVGSRNSASGLAILPYVTCSHFTAVLYVQDNAKCFPLFCGRRRGEGEEAGAGAPAPFPLPSGRKRGGENGQVKRRSRKAETNRN